MRIDRMIYKELKCTKENVAFHVATILSPLLFLFAFWLMLSGGIALPAQTYPDTASSPFLNVMAQYHAPDGTPYLLLHTAQEATPPTNADSNSIVIREEPSFNNGVWRGTIEHYINDVNENMTKNFRNRLHGALVSYLHTTRDHGNVLIDETTVYPQDIPWNTGFGVNVFVFGLMLSGLLFGMLSMTGEWENNTTTLLKLAPGTTLLTATGKTIASLLKGIVSGMLFLAIFFALSKALPIHPLSLIAVLFLVYGVFICAGICLGIFVHSTLTAFLLSLATALTLWVGGGGFGSLSYFGAFANALGRLNPATYAIDLVRWCYFDGHVHFYTDFLVLIGACVTAYLLMLLVYLRWMQSEEVQ